MQTMFTQVRGKLEVRVAMLLCGLVAVAALPSTASDSSRTANQMRPGLGYSRCSTVSLARKRTTDATSRQPPSTSVEKRGNRTVRQAFPRT